MLFTSSSTPSLPLIHLIPSTAVVLLSLSSPCVGDNFAARQFPVHVSDQVLPAQRHHTRPRLPGRCGPCEQGDGDRKGRVDAAETGHGGRHGQRMEENIRLW